MYVINYWYITHVCHICLYIYMLYDVGLRGCVGVPPLCNNPSIHYEWFARKRPHYLTKSHESSASFHFSNKKQKFVMSIS